MILENEWRFSSCPCRLASAFSASAACLGNVGPGFGVVGAAQTYAPLNVGAKLVLIAAMAIGGGLGSTAGGLKLLRLLILLRLVQVFLWRSAMPSRAVVEPRLGGKRLSDDDLQRAALLLGDREVLAGDHPAQTDTLAFLVRDAPLGDRHIRLRIDGVDSLLVDRSVTPPAYDSAAQVTIT